MLEWPLGTTDAKSVSFQSIALNWCRIGIGFSHSSLFQAIAISWGRIGIGFSHRIPVWSGSPSIHVNGNNVVVHLSKLKLL